MAQPPTTPAPRIFNQYGALAALSPRRRRIPRGSCCARCASGRDVVEDFIAGQNRVRWMKPDGAFYGFLHVDGLKDSLALRQDMVRKRQCRHCAGLGLQLGDPRDESYVRICFAQRRRGTGRRVSKRIETMLARWLYRLLPPRPRRGSRQ